MFSIYITSILSTIIKIYPWYFNHGKCRPNDYHNIYIYINHEPWFSSTLYMPFPWIVVNWHRSLISQPLFHDGKADVVIKPIIQGLVQEELQQRLERRCRSTRRGRWRRWRQADHVAHETFHEFPEAQAFLERDLWLMGGTILGNITWWFPQSWGYPNSWMVFVRENPDLKWMMNRGSPILGNPHIRIR